jgi:hypothetical protein
VAWNPGQGDRLSPPGFEPKPIIPNSRSYIERHPTRYFFRPDIAETIRLVYREFGGPAKLHINTYEEHPPNPDAGNRALWLGMNTERISLDVWGPGLRGDPLLLGLHDDVFEFLFYRRPAPDFWWTVTRGDMWVRARNPLRDGGFWLASPPGPADSDPLHIKHLHITFLSLIEQQMLRPGYTVEQGVADAKAGKI